MFSRLLGRRSFVVVGAVALASVGGGAAFAGSGDAEFVTCVTAPVPVRELLLDGGRLLFGGVGSPCRAKPPSGLLSFTVSAPGAISTPEFTKEGSKASEDGCTGGRACLERNAIADAAATVSPSVVNISHLSAKRSYYGVMIGKSIGCGTIIDPDGTILTCAHVVVDRNSPRSLSQRKVDVTLEDGRQFEGIVLNVDFQSDIAVIKINSKTPLPAAKLGTSQKLRPGEWVLALGCPLSLQNTVTAGIVSCVDRKSSDLGLGGVHREYLQVDCAINEGNSGGPLVNLDGEVVGINIMKIAAADGLSFALPIDSVRKIVEHFKKSGRVIRPWLGLKTLDLNETIIRHLKERDSSFPDVREGVLVPTVTPGSPADRAGFRPGDVIVEFDGRRVETAQEIVDSLEHRVGVSVKVLVIRANNHFSTLTVVPMEANPEM